jgi:plastocyanin
MHVLGLLLPLTALACGSDTPVEGAAAPFAGCSPDSAVKAEHIKLSPPASYEPRCVTVAAGATVLIEADSMHPLQGMVKNGTTPNPIAQGEPKSGYTSPSSFHFPLHGAYGFYCNVHGSDTDKAGSMTGVVFVK